MVLEHLFPEDWIEKKILYPFLLGTGYSIIGIIIAKILFPADYKLLSIEKRIEDKEKKFSFTKLFKDNKDFVKIYIFIALGIFLVYAFAAIMLPSFQVNNLFREQLEMRGAGGIVAGGAVFQAGLFMDILVNNWWVLVACFLIALLTGNGAIFLITWNASVWGIIFGVTARNAAIASQADPFFYLLIVLVIVLPHAFIEMLAYILAGISGGVISKDVILEKFDSSRFREVFQYNFWLFIVAVIVLVIGVIVETWVLGNVSLYKEIIMKSYLV